MTSRGLASLGPRFAPGKRLYHRGHSGSIVECINAHDKTDVRRQGYRYYFKSRGWIWSVRECELAASPAKSRLLFNC